MFFEWSKEELFAKEIRNILWTRWRIIEESTNYGWISANYSPDLMIPECDLEKISILINKLDYETCYKALEKVRKVTAHLHPRQIPNIVSAVFEEYYMIFLLRNREKKKSNPKIVKGNRSIIYTIS